MKRVSSSRKTKEKKLNIIIIIAFICALIAEWTFDTDVEWWPFNSIFINEDSAYIKYLSYNRGNDFTVFSDSSIDYDIDNHNYFITTVVPKSYSENGIQVSVNRNGSIQIQGLIREGNCGLF